MSKTKKKHRLFVYGTLRDPRVAPTHHVAGVQMFNYRNQFPYLVRADGMAAGMAATVVGSVYELTTAQLRAADKYEGVEHGLYRRETIDVYAINEDGKTLRPDGQAFVYVAGNIAPSPIHSGDWFNR